MNNLNNPDTIKKGDYGYSSESLSRRASKQTRRNAEPLPNSKKDRPTQTDRKLKRSTNIGLVLFVIQLIASGVFVYFLHTKFYDYVPDLYIWIADGVVAFFLILVLILILRKKIVVKRVGKIISVIVSIILILLSIFGSDVLNRLGAGKGAKLSEHPFVVFVTASDEFGQLQPNRNYRSDTNMLVAVNPDKHTVMIVSIPRDYYIPVYGHSIDEKAEIRSNVLEKLTHIGLYGNGHARNRNTGKAVGASGWNYAQEVSWDHGDNDNKPSDVMYSIKTSLQKLLKFKVDPENYHYAQLNFTGFGKLVDALGGITVDVKKGFSYTTYANYDVKEDDGSRRKYTFKKGKMEMDGNEALTYARTRKKFANGDLQRNKNQVAVIKAIADKAISSGAILNYTNVVDAVKESMSTDIDIASVATLHKIVSGHSDYDGWKIVRFSVKGESASQKILWNGQYASVVQQDETSINYAGDLLNNALSGMKYDELKKLAKSYSKKQGN